MAKQAQQIHRRNQYGASRDGRGKLTCFSLTKAITASQYEGSDTLYPADSVIVSISQGPQNTITRTTSGLNANPRGLLIADENGHTSHPGVFASGDAVNGAKTVVEAVAHSKKVAEAMHAYIQSQVEKDE